MVGGVTSLWQVNYNGIPYIVISGNTKLKNISTNQTIIYYFFNQEEK